MKTFYLIHRWDASPVSDWYPWLKNNLKDSKLVILKMPDTSNPKIKEWVSFLKNNVEDLNENIYFIGHSIGCQTILRFLESLHSNIKIGGCFFVAGWFKLNTKIIEEEGVESIAKPWIETPIDFDKVLQHTHNFTLIYSDNDPYVSVEDSKLFEKNLKAKLILEKGKEHFTDNELPTLLKEISKL